MRKKVVIKLTSTALAATLIGIPVFNNFKKSGNKGLRNSASYSATVLEVGDHDTKELSFEELYLKYCDRKDVDTVIVVSPDGKTISDICDDVEYTKSLVANYNIGPVFLDVEPIMANRDLTINQKLGLIETYLNKVSANGIYVGLAGTNTTLYNLSETDFDTTLYDTYLIEDGDEDKKYVGTSSFIKNEDGQLEIVNADIFNLIKESDFNNPNNFLQDAYYIVNDPTDLEYVINSHNISMNDLLRYNGLSYDEIEKGTILKIPNKSQGKRENHINEYAISKGIDISEFQSNENANWEMVKSNVDFMIIRAIWSTNIDSSFEKHYAKAMEHDIPIGVYSYSYATSKEEMKDEAKFLVSQLQDKNITYPVYLDLEDQKTCLKMDDKELIEGIKAWTEIVREAGYIPGIYTNGSIYYELTHKFNSIEPGFLTQFDLWLAGSPNYNNQVSINDIEDSGCIAGYNEMPIECNMRQVSQVCTDVGIGTEAGYVDFNFCYTRYEKTLSQNFPIKSFNRINLEEISVYTGLSIVGALVTYGGIKFIIANNKKKKDGIIRTL